MLFALPCCPPYPEIPLVWDHAEFFPMTATLKKSEGDAGTFQSFEMFALYTTFSGKPAGVLSTVIFCRPSGIV